MATIAEQERKIVELLSVLGETVNYDVARALLESGDWDSEVVLHNFLDSGVEETVRSSTPTRRSSTPPRGSSTSRPADRAPVSTQVDTAPSSDAMAQEDFANYSIEDLRGLLTASDIDHSFCSDKHELARMLRDVVHGGGRTSGRCQPWRATGGYAAQVCPHPAERRIDPMLGGLAVTYSEMRQFLADQHLSESQCRSHWENLSIRPPCSRRLSAAEMQRHREEQETQALINAERRAEVAEQDAEYEESLRMDQLREAKQKEAEAQQKEAEGAKRKLQESQAEAILEAEKVLEQKRLRVSQPEADKTDPDRLQIGIRAPSGKRFSRIFRASDSVDFLYDWIDVTCAEEDFTKGSYQLTARLPGMPPKELLKSSEARTLKEAGVEHQSVFFITSL